MYIITFQVFIICFSIANLILFWLFFFRLVILTKAGQDLGPKPQLSSSLMASLLLYNWVLNEADTLESSSNTVFLHRTEHTYMKGMAWCQIRLRVLNKMECAKFGKDKNLWILGLTPHFIDKGFARKSRKILTDFPWFLWAIR